MKTILSLITLFLTNAAVAQDAAPAAGSAPEGPGIASLIIQVGVIFVVFYIFLIRPQNKKMKQHALLVSQLKKGDSIITSGGIVATVVKAEEKARFIEVEIASGVKIEILRSAVTEVVTNK